MAVSDKPDSGKPSEKRKRESKLVGFSKQLETRRRERAERNKPQPWIILKLVVGFVIAIVCYAWYVYIGRFCAPMIRRDETALGGRAVGIAFLVVFCLLGLMFWWTYVKLIFTSPGYAKDHVNKSPVPFVDTRRSRGGPPPSSPRSHVHQFGDNNHEVGDKIGGVPYSEIPDTPAFREGTIDLEKQAGSSSLNTSVPAPKRRPSGRGRKSSRGSRRDAERTENPGSADPQAGILDAVAPGAGRKSEMYSNPKLSPLPPKDSTPAKIADRQRSQSRAQALPSTDVNGGLRSDDDGLPPVKFSRHPRTEPVLLPEFRYCRRDDFVKPMRAHHCRQCATCVLMYDHHCPWVGQCVGARNHKFFVNFLQWSSPWTLWIFTTMVALNAKKSSDPGFSVDGQQIAIIALSALFSIFTIPLLGAHIRLILLNQTTIESMIIHDMKARERDMIGTMVPLWNWRRENVHRKRDAIRKEWDDEWGKLDTEGNIWWLGNGRANWENRMGKNPWGWFLPIGRSQCDGLTYPRNPRFDADGRWRRRKDWPSVLR